MKQVTITTGKATIVVVDLRDKKWKWAKPCFIGDQLYRHIDNPNEKFWSEIVRYQGHPWCGYEDYTNKSNWFSTATESGLSLLKSNGIVLENPLGTKPRWDELAPSEYPHDYLDHLEKWQKAQEQVWSNPQIFIKL